MAYGLGIGPSKACFGDMPAPSAPHIILAGPGPRYFPYGGVPSTVSLYPGIGNLLAAPFSVGDYFFRHTSSFPIDLSMVHPEET